MGVDNFNWIHGAHTFKAGFEVRATDSKRTQYGGNVVHMYNSLPDLISDKIFPSNSTSGIPAGVITTTRYAGYFQDEWKVNRRMQLNLGLRYKYYTVFAGSIGLATTDPFGPRTLRGEPIWEPDRNNFAPAPGWLSISPAKGRPYCEWAAESPMGRPSPFITMMTPGSMPACPRSRW